MAIKAATKPRGPAPLAVPILDGDRVEVPAAIPRHGGNGNPKIRRLDDPTKFDYYTRASGFAKVVEDTYNLERWTQRLIAYGMGHRPDLVLRAAAVQVWEDRDDKVRHDAVRAELGDIVARALEEAKGDRAATRGTAFHLLSEQADAGRDLSHLASDIAHGLAIWRHFMSIFRIVSTETFIVHDRWRVGGSFDRLVELLVRVTIRDGDGKVLAVLKPGTRLIVDLKTGRTSDYFGPAYGGQLATYAGGVPYVHVDDEAAAGGDDGRRAWPDDIAPSQEWAVIPHVPVDRPGEAQLVWVDLSVGRRWGDLAAGVRADRGLPAFYPAEVDGLGPPPTGPAPAPTADEQFVAAMLERIGAAPDEAALGALYDQHAADWRPEFTAAAIVRHAELDGPAPAPAEPGPLDCVDCLYDFGDAPVVDGPGPRAEIEAVQARVGALAAGPAGRLADLGAGADLAVAFMVDDGYDAEQAAVAVAAGVHCPECTEPDEDPAPWCDCQSGEQGQVPCRNRAHSPDRCPTLGPAHVLAVHSPSCPTKDDGSTGCPVCDWGADECTVCGEAEGGLAPPCPGSSPTQVQVVAAIRAATTVEAIGAIYEETEALGRWTPYLGQVAGARADELAGATS